VNKAAGAVMDENYGIRTLSTFVLQKEKQGVIDNELGVVITSIALACKQIATLVNRSGISNLTGLAGGAQNIQVPKP
jgi:fructose-1,6-bisphosphatase I